MRVESQSDESLACVLEVVWLLPLFWISSRILLISSLLIVFAAVVVCVVAVAVAVTLASDVVAAVAAFEDAVVWAAVILLASAVVVVGVDVVVVAVASCWRFWIWKATESVSQNSFSPWPEMWKWKSPSVWLGSCKEISSVAPRSASWIYY